MKLLKGFTLFILTLLTALSVFAQPATWTKRAGVSMTSGTNGFYEYKPAGYNGTTKFPVIIALHGINECGNGTTDLDNILVLGIPQQIQNYGFPYNAMVICPQVSSPWPGPSTIEGIINYVRNNYAVDTTRLYLTGLSMGGGSILDWAEVGSIYKVAAMAPVCPSSVWQTFGNRYKAYDMPFWFFHGDADATVSIGNSIGWVTNLNATPGITPYARLDTLAGVGHNAWSYVYDYGYIIPGTGMTVYQWLLSKQRTNYSGVPGGGGGSPPPSDTIRVNIGGTADVTKGYKVWKKLSEGNVSGGVFTDVNIIWGTDQTINNTALYDTIVYKSQRRTSLGSNIVYPVNNGTYRLRLYFCEFWKNTAGTDVFNITVEGTPVLTNFDVIAQSGGRYNAIYRDFDITIADGNLNLGIVPVTGDGMLNGFEIYPITLSNLPPIANAGTDRVITLPNNQTNLFGSGSTDPDGSLTGYSWSTISGPPGSAFLTPTSTSPVFYNLVAGTYQVQLTVTDNNGATDSDTVQVTVNPAANVPPVSNLGPNTFTVLPKDSVVLTNSATDGDGTVTSFQYLKISGTGGSFRNPTSATTAFYGLTPGTYTVRGIATDNVGATGSDTIVITVYPPVNTPPTVSAGTDKTITLPVDTVRLTGTASDNNGSISSYLWTVTPSAGVTIQSPASPSTRVTFTSPGTYTMRLTVTDDSSTVAFDEAVVTVNPSVGLSYVTNVYQVYHSATYPVAALLTFTDNTSIRVTNHSGASVRKIAKRFQVVDGLTRPVAYIWFNDGYLRVITKKGE